MPLDTSIALGVQNPQIQSMNPASVYQMVQEQRANALRNQLVQQEMAKNAMIMQNTAEDRRAAAAQRAQAQAMLARRNAILGQFGTTDAAVGAGPGTKYTNNNLNADPYAYVRNQLIKMGDVGEAANIAELQNKTLTGAKTSAEIPGVAAESAKKNIETVDAQLKQLNAGLERAASPEEVDALFDGSADAIRMTGKTPDMSKAAFRQLAAQVGFDAAKMQVAQGVMTTQKHFSDMLTGQAGRSDVTQDAAGNQIIIDKATGTAMPVTMAAPAGAPAAGAPAPVKAKMTPEQEKTAVKNKEAAKGIDEATSILKDLIKPDSLLDQSTGSYLGSWADAAVRGSGFGATKGSQATAQLRVFADPILKMIPRFEGPQSDKDTQTYKEAAGMLADDTVPAADRRAAAKALLALFERRKGQFEQASGAIAPSAAANAAPAGFEGWGIKKVGE